MEQCDQRVEIVASHNGYRRLKGRVTHTRTVTATPNELCIVDHLDGEWKMAAAMYHFHPDIQISRLDDYSVRLVMPDGREVAVKSSDLLSVEACSWHPQFGLSLPNQKIIIPFTSSSLAVAFLFSGSAN